MGEVGFNELTAGRVLHTGSEFILTENFDMNERLFPAVDDTPIKAKKTP